VIRYASPSDIPRLVEMGRNLHAATGDRAIAPYSEKDTATFFANLIGDGPGMALALDDVTGTYGMMAGIVSPLYFNFSVTVCQELFIWAEPGHRGGFPYILWGIEQHAKARGADMMIMAASELLRPKPMQRLLEMSGYKPFERLYVKEL
jgi:hypothetical protein